MSGKDQPAEVVKPKVQAQADEPNIEEALYKDAVADLSRSIKSEDVTGGLKALDEKIYKLDLGPVAADRVINDVFAELKRTGELPDLISKFYAENKQRLFQDGKTYLDIESLERRLPGAGVYDLNRVERHAAAFIADKINTISEAKYNMTYSVGQTSDADFPAYAKQQREMLDRFLMAQKINKHFGAQDSFSALDRADSGKTDGRITTSDIAAAQKFNAWMADFAPDAASKKVAQERQEVLNYLADKFYSIPGYTAGLDKTELVSFTASEKDPRLNQVLKTDSRLFVGNPGPEAYQDAVAKGYKGSLGSFTTEFVDAKMKEGMTREEAMRALNQSKELHGFRADVIKQYLTANKEALGATKSDEISLEALKRLREVRANEGKLREVAILDTAINRFATIANADKESSWGDDVKIKSVDLDTYAAREKTNREKAALSVKMHNLAHANIHELSGESTEKAKGDIKVPWSKIESMKKHYSGVGQDANRFTAEERAHNKQMAEVCDYLIKNFKGQTTGRGGNPNYTLDQSYRQATRLETHTKDKFDAPKKVEPPAPPKVQVEAKPEEPPVTEAPKKKPEGETSGDGAPETEITDEEVQRTLNEITAEILRFEQAQREKQRAEAEGNADEDVLDVFKEPAGKPVVPPPKVEAPKEEGKGNEPAAEESTGEGSAVEPPKETKPVELPRDQRPPTPQEIERAAAGARDQSAERKVEEAAVAGKLTAAEFAKAKEAFAYDAKNYANALRQAARQNLPLVLIAGTKNSSPEFLKSAAAQAEAGKDKAVYVFVDLDQADPNAQITKYLESSIAGRNVQTNRHDDNWASVFKVRSDGQGGVKNDSPLYLNSGDQAANQEALQKAIEDIKRNVVPITRAQVVQRPAYVQNGGQTYSYGNCQPQQFHQVQNTQYQPVHYQGTQNYYSSPCRPRGSGRVRQVFFR